MKKNIKHMDTLKLLNNSCFPKLNENADDNWDDLFTMIDDISEHAKNNGRAVIEEDRPHLLRLAWRCTNTNKTWSIKISKLKLSINTCDDEKKDLLMNTFQTQEGKIIFTESLNSKK